MCSDHNDQCYLALKQMTTCACLYGPYSVPYNTESVAVIELSPKGEATSGRSSRNNFWLMYDAGCLPVNSDLELHHPLRLRVERQPSQEQYNVFVYGSLLPNLHNHWLISNAEFLGYHKTQPNFEMFSLGQFPAVCGGGHTAIFGALYRVNRATRDKLDLLEQHPVWYRREQVELLTNRPTLAWIYLMSREEPEIKASWVKPVPSGDWFTYFTARQANALGHHFNTKSGLHALYSDE